MGVETAPAHKLVVVLDDDPGVLKAIGRLLKARGFECELFSSAQDFRDRAQLDRSMCLILDVNLDGESGIELRRKLSETWPSIPVVFITANDGEGNRQAAIEAGFSPKAFFSKFFDGRCREGFSPVAMPVTARPDHRRLSTDSSLHIAGVSVHRSHPG